ncbi:MAG: type II toxin-antitoxin system VapC family toxin [Candidatus Aminicenantes bacterium]|jgi:tRNA(fMet)-specific endonuclease VapC
MKRILLDTNAYSKLLAGDEKVLSILAESDVVYMSIFVLGELYAGFKGGNKEQENKQLLKMFIQKPTVEILEATEETSKVFGQVKNDLKKAGTPLPINDVWIAAHTLESGSTLITYDIHFQEIPDLRLWEYL